MSRHVGVSRAIAYSLGAALGASTLVLLIGLWLFGFDLAQWSESEGRWVGVAGTIGGVLGAAVGPWIGGRAERRAAR
jgi:hypothetical protein